MKKKKVILDCDPGVDDALAIMLAVNSEEVSLEGITTVHGNVSLEQANTNALRLLDFLGEDICVGKGVSEPLIYDRISAGSVHGSDGLGDSSMLSRGSLRECSYDGAGMIIEKVKGGVKSLVATGPLTNVALAFERDSETMNSLDELVIMGGNVYTSGNTRLSEFNFYVDPHAVKYVLEQDVRKVIVPLDVTKKVLLTDEALLRLPENEKGELVKSMVAKYREFYMTNIDLEGNPLHDPLAMGYAINKDFVRVKPMCLDINVGNGDERGCVFEYRIFEGGNRPNCEVALEVDSSEFLNYFVNTVAKD
jgi:purine nucleosidase